MGNDLPDTILYPENFKKSVDQIECPNCGYNFPFDGVFNWGWAKGCFGNTKIMPMDIDGIVERKKHYLVIETKDINVPISKGQVIMLDNLRNAKSFTIFKIWGKDEPKRISIVRSNGEIIPPEDTTTETVRGYVKKWFDFCNK